MKKLCLFDGGDLVVRTYTDNHTELPTADELNGIPTAEKVFATADAEAAAVVRSEVEPLLPSGLQFQPLRPLFLTMPAEQFAVACKARQMVQWETHSRYCPACGVPTAPLAFNARKCPQCGFEIYPTIAPAIIVRIHRGKELLMVRALNFRGNHYGLVAGFVEVGESLEECVTREVMEETSLKIKNIRYYGSQPWPFPSSLMIGFDADYESGDIHLQKEELADGQFFTATNPPELPAPMSIARCMIDEWLKAQ
ncbi:MAG: NAD(+) diphosphatase [Bacteroidales bacterium]|jgi:NAD+ diphosphatase|nr:NAD(+) diphosphatase [Bacteroidales bacterium]